MTQPKYLQLVDKWQTLQHWIGVEPRLTRSALVVLIRLLDHQNPKTGRCDPSVQRIQDKTGLCERSVRKAMSELKDCGAIDTTRKTLRSRNQVALRKTGAHKQNHSHKAAHENTTGVQHRSSIPALQCRPSLHSTAPEKEKKKEIEKGGGVGEFKQTGQGAEKTVNHKCHEDHSDNLGTVNQGQFESSVVKVLGKNGYTYIDLVQIDGNLFESIFNTYSSGKVTFSKAVNAIIAECCAVKGRGEL